MSKATTFCTLIGFTLCNWVELQHSAAAEPTKPPKLVTAPLDNCTLKVTGPASIKSGKLLKLTIVMKNNGPLDADCDIRGVERDFTFELKTGKGKDIPLTAAGKKLIAGPSVAPKSTDPARQVQFRSVWGLSVGAQNEYHLDLGQLYELSAPGKYQLTVSRQFYVGSGGLLKKKTVTVFAPKFVFDVEAP